MGDRLLAGLPLSIFGVGMLLLGLTGPLVSMSGMSIGPASICLLGGALAVWLGWLLPGLVLPDEKPEPALPMPTWPYSKHEMDTWVLQEIYRRGRTYGAW